MIDSSSKQSSDRRQQTNITIVMGFIFRLDAKHSNIRMDICIAQRMARASVYIQIYICRYLARAPAVCELTTCMTPILADTSITSVAQKMTKIGLCRTMIKIIWCYCQLAINGQKVIKTLPAC